MYLTMKMKWRQHSMNKGEIVDYMVDYIEEKERELQSKEKLTSKEKSQYVKKIINELERVIKDEN